MKATEVHQCNRDKEHDEEKVTRARQGSLSDDVCSDVSIVYVSAHVKQAFHSMLMPTTQPGLFGSARSYAEADDETQCKARLLGNEWRIDWCNGIKGHLSSS